MPSPTTEPSPPDAPIRVVHDPRHKARFAAEVMPHLREHHVHAQPFDASDPPALEEGARLLCWLSDTGLRQLLPLAKAHRWQLGILPHPDLQLGQAAMAVPHEMEAAVTAALDASSATPIDLLYCNQQIVFGSVVIGDPFTLAPRRAPVESLWARLRRLFTLARHLGNVRLTPFRLQTEKEKELETAALGIIAVDRGDASPLTRNVIAPSRADDQMLNALILSPRSLMEALRFLAASLLLRRVGQERPPRFIGHIRSRSLRISTPQPIGYTVDGHTFSDQQIDLTIDPAAVAVLNAHLPQGSTSAVDDREVFRTQGLPTESARTKLVAEPLPWLHHADSEEFKELFLTLREHSRTSESYLTLMVLSTLLAVLGLFADSAPVIIGAMILAPLMAPIISLSMGVLRQHDELIRDSAKALLWGVGLALLCAVALTWLTPLQTLNSQIEARLSPTLLDLGIAIVSGIAGAYAHARSEVARSLAGVAIAVALVPPLAVAGIGIGWLDWTVFWGAWLLFLTNLAGIVLAAALTFMLLGFSPFSRARRGLLFSLLVVCVISVPLLLGFARMVDEAHIVRSLEGWQSDHIQLTEVRVRHARPLHVSARLLSDQPLTPAEIDQTKQRIEERLERPIRLEATLAIVR